MILVTLAFYLFASVLITSGVMVISSRNPVHSVLFLILAFFNAAGMFVLLGAEFLAMLLVIVYVGAVMVLFLFVVMMLDINIVKLKEGYLKYLPVGVVVASVLFMELGIALYASVNGVRLYSPPAVDAVSNTEALGRVLYTDYIYLFQIAGAILLVAMVGAIVLTLRQREGVKRQRIERQLSRNARNAIEIVKVETGRGV